MEMMEKKKVKSGIYLVIDPSLDKTILLYKLQLVLEEEIAAVQVWDHFMPHQSVPDLIRKITSLCHEKNVPVLINNQWEWLMSLPLDGVHFDNIPHDFERIQKVIDREFIAGLTCNNDLSYVHWANNYHFDYISFCSVFPSSTSNSCELVKSETIQKTREITTMPVFLAGGIKPENIRKLKELSFDGIAVISGVMGSDNPDEAVREYVKQLKANKP
jgi:Thiamine monophosphate synthase